MSPTKHLAAGALILAAAACGASHVQNERAQTPALAPSDAELLPADAGLCPLDLPQQNVSVDRLNDDVIVTVTTIDPTQLNELRERARQIADRGYYAPASAYEDAISSENTQVVYSGIAVDVELLEIDDGIRIVLTPRAADDAEALAKQLESDKALLTLGHCDYPPAEIAVELSKLQT